MTDTAGHYPIDHRDGEIERLHTQGDAMAPDAAIMLDRIGVREGWRCLDLGCGPRGITPLLSARVGTTGCVVGLDADAGFLDHARHSAPANVTFVRSNAYGSDLPGGSFDLVHLRFVASTAGDPPPLLREAIRLARPGGIVALQEPDMTTLNCDPPHPAWDQLRTALIGAFAAVGADISLGRKLYTVAREAGLEDVQYRTFLVAVRSIDPMVDYLPSTVESLRRTVVGHGLMTEAALDAALAACRAHLHDPGTVFTMYTVAQVWGRTPG
jgi:ubiquinone/menaquinone biosynthesis C-methylase UbiE